MLQRETIPYFSIQNRGRKAISELIKLNFAPAIRASDINYNFDIVKGWIDRERRRVGGYGLVEGFDITADENNFTVSVTKGTMISPDGEEREVSGTTFNAGPPEYFTRTETIVCPPDGIITLDRRPYNPRTHGYQKLIPPRDTEYPPESEFKIFCTEYNSRVYYVQIDNNKIWVSHPEVWVNKKLVFTYLTSDDRIDSVILTKDGQYHYEKSINSTSPSHVELPDYYKHDMLIGVIYWKLGIPTTYRIYTNHRTYRPIYVDKDNVLYLNGKPYREAKFIYFVEPEEPQEDDLWYDKESNTLYIWLPDQGGWVPVNDFSTVTKRESKMYFEQDWPEDKQTFIFPKDQPNLRYVPKTNALEIVMDNATFMSDQYEEITSLAPGAPEYMAQGIGFRLKEPMDRKTPLEVIVNHQVKAKPTRSTFQRAAVFISEDHVIKLSTNKTQTFNTKNTYVVGGDQLEVWIDGLRLVPHKDFLEMMSETQEATEEDRKKANHSSSYFKVTVPIKDGAVVNYRISKQVWSYDQVAQLFDDITTTLKELKNETKRLDQAIKDSNENISNQIAAVQQRTTNLEARQITDVVAAIPEHSLGLNKLDKSIQSKFITGFIDKSHVATTIPPLKNIRVQNCFLQVALISPKESRLLIKNVDYTLADTSNGLRVDLNPDFISSDNTAHLFGFILGGA